MTGARGEASAVGHEEDRHTPELTVVIPVYNEASVLKEVVTGWLTELERLRIRHTVWLCDDGSTDSSSAIITKLANIHGAIQAVSQHNRGHGPTILRGYREARGDWVLQVDGDGEVGPEAFGMFWASREDADFVIGHREATGRPIIRRVVSQCARYATRALLGTRLHDVNVPFRLMRLQAMRRLLPLIPPDTFAPNVVISALASAGGFRVRELPVVPTYSPHQSSTLSRFRLLPAATLALVQTAQIAWRFRRHGQSALAHARHVDESGSRWRK